MQHAVKMLPNHVAFRINLVLIADRAGEFQLIEDEVNAMQQPDPRAIVALAYSQIARGMPREATETTKRLRPWIRETRGLVRRRRRAGLRGPFFRGRSDFRAGCRGRSEQTRAALKFLSAGHAHLQRGQNGPAAAAADKALQLSTVTAVRFLAAQIFAATGAIDKAEALAAELSKSTDHQMTRGFMGRSSRRKSP